MRISFYTSSNMTFKFPKVEKTDFFNLLEDSLEETLFDTNS